MNDGLPVLRHFLVQHYEQLKRSVTRRIGCQDLAGDALQETWLRLQRDEAEHVVRNPKAYLTRMAVNISIDALRRQSHVLSMEEIESLMEMAPDSAPGPAEIADDRSQLLALQDILVNMPKRRREVLILVRWENWSQKDVAQHLGVSLRVVEYELKAAQEYCAARLSQRNNLVR